MTKFNFEATGVGSVPFKDPKQACEMIFSDFPYIPFWPQLTRSSYLENMYVQFSERLPGLVLNENKRTIHVDTARAAADIENVYTKFLDGDIEFFGISKDYAKGFYEFLNAAKKLPKDVKFLKGHVTGPISYALSLTDEKRRSILYDMDLFEALTKVLVMKARWQIEKLKKIFPSVIIFIDEPSLVSLGSSYVNINTGLAFSKVDELAGAIKDEGALCGLHCCGNTDWPVLLRRNIDIISFDAYNFTKKLLLYTAELKGFLQGKGTLAWGIVPTSEEIDKEKPEVLARRLTAAVDMLAKKGIEKDKISSLVTPSCGVGTMSEERARKIFRATKTISETLRR